MKVFSMILMTVIVTALAVSTEGQTRLSTNNSSNPLNLPPTVAAASLIAIVDSGEFTEQKTGINRVVSALAQLNAKYDGVNKEIKDMQTRLNTLRSDIQNKRQVQDPKITQQQSDQAEQLDLQIKRKAEDAQASFQKEMNTAMGPLQTDIGNALDAYAKAHGILLIIDANRVPLIYADASIDITKDFIAEYNKTHPATTPAAPTRP
ncbi:MAG TPA: OmpH family outer membrane protein [Pyrinomonadaceae bacterium]|nr:OmpH family outer membrane protein [Pyrinomonadaceae bacterium]